MLVRQCGRGHELVAILTPEALHERAGRCEALAEVNGHAAVASIGRKRLTTFPVLYARAHRLFDAAHRYAAQAREAAAALVAAPVIVECGQCGRDTNAADMVPQDNDEDICRACHQSNVEEGNRLHDEDWRSYNESRGV